MMTGERGAGWQSTGETWLGAPVSESEGTPAELRAHVPIFERRPFLIAPTSGRAAQLNPLLDTIVRLPLRDEPEVAVGVVSKSYTLIQHREILDTAVAALAAAGVSDTDVRASLRMTEYGERMALKLLLPSTYDFNPGDSQLLSLELRCINSVDATTSVTVMAGWMRLVCSNGLVVRDTRVEAQQSHNAHLRFETVEAAVKSGIDAALEERSKYHRWVAEEIPPDTVRRWADGQLKARWGVKAATRAYHILTSGYDVELTVPFEKGAPSEKTVTRTRRVPGAPVPGSNAFAVAQALAWLARQAPTVQDQMVRVLEVSGIVDALVEEVRSANGSRIHR